MSIIAGHLRCDCEKIRGSKCPNNLYPPSKEKTLYYHCPSENLDFLCEACVNKQYEFQEDGAVKNTVFYCLNDGSKLEERFWPEK